MLLAIDIGNTNITLGLYDGEVPGPRWRLSTASEKTADEYGLYLLGLLRRAGFDASSVTDAAISSVVPQLTGQFAESCRKYLKCEALVIEGSSKTGVAIKCDNPSEVGSDRIVDAAAVRKLYGGPACIVDFGTATTFDAVDRGGDYLGGAIAPGVGISAEALFRRAAKLPKVDLDRPPAVIGRSMVQSLQSGLLFGYVGLVEGMVARFRDILGEDMKVIATGGLAEIIAKETDVISVVAPWLTLDGLRIIYELNRGRAE